VALPPFSLEIGQMVLLLSSAERLREHNVGIVSRLVADGYRVIVITTNQPLAILKKFYLRDGVDLSRILFVDTITRYAVGSSPENTAGERFITNPSDLTDLGITISEILKEGGEGKTAVLFDSVSTMLIYLPSAQISRFIHFLTNKLRILDVAGILLTVEMGLDPLLLSQLTTFVDQVVYLDAPAPSPTAVTTGA
jgi:KaiC/GvpD/RAD55 family RecA-like ATPase